MDFLKETEAAAQEHEKWVKEYLSICTTFNLRPLNKEATKAFHEIYRVYSQAPDDLKGILSVKMLPTLAFKDNTLLSYVISYDGKEMYILKECDMSNKIYAYGMYQIALEIVADKRVVDVNKILQLEYTFAANDILPELRSRIEPAYLKCLKLWRKYPKLLN